MTDKQVENIKNTIKSYKAKLSGEKRKFGGYIDNQGLRYEIALLYAKIKDFNGAKKYYQWFDKEFGDDVGFPEFHLARVVTMFENNDIDTAIKKVYAVAFANSQIIDLIPKENIKDIINFESFDKDLKGSIEFCAHIITPRFLDWVGKFIESDGYKKNVKKSLLTD